VCILLKGSTIAKIKQTIGLESNWLTPWKFICHRRKPVAKIAYACLLMVVTYCSVCYRGHEQNINCKEREHYRSCSTLAIAKTLTRYRFSAAYVAHLQQLVRRKYYVDVRGKQGQACGNFVGKWGRAGGSAGGVRVADPVAVRLRPPAGGGLGDRWRSFVQRASGIANC